MQAHAFLKEHGVHLRYSLEDMGQGRGTARDLEENLTSQSDLQLTEKEVNAQAVDDFNLENVSFRGPGSEPRAPLSK